MNHYLYRINVLLQQGIWVRVNCALPKECSSLKAFTPSFTSRPWVLSSGEDFRLAPAKPSLLTSSSGIDLSRYFCAAAFPYVWGTGRGVSRCIRRVHTTSPCQGVASKLKETPVYASDDIDPSKPADFNPSNYDAAEARSAPSEKIFHLVNEIANLTLIDAADLSYILKKKLGLPDSAMPYYGGGMGANMGGAASGSASPAAEEEKKPEKTNFDVKLEKFDAASKIKVIKEVRTFTSLGLKEAKELVEKLPAIVKHGVVKEEAEKMIEKLKAVGAVAVLE